jgi:hypothetical protein
MRHYHHKVGDVGRPSNNPHRSQRVVSIGGIDYSSARVAWILGWGADGPPVPPAVCFIDGDKNNLKLGNLGYPYNKKRDKQYK